MSATAPDAAAPLPLVLRRVVPVLLTVLCLAAGCAAPPTTGEARTTSTLATTADPIPSSGPGVEPSFETGVPDAVVSFAGGVAPDGPGAVAADGRPDEVVRSADGDLLVTTWGSSTCPRMPVSVVARDLTTIDIVTGSVRVDPAAGRGVGSETLICTSDLGSTISTVRLPEGAAGAGPLTVVVDGVPYAVP